MLLSIMTALRSYLKKLIEKYKVEFLESLENLRGYSDLTIKSYAETLNEASNYVKLHEEDEIITLELM